MLRRSKTLSIVMSLCLCLAMLAPVFVAPSAAQAAENITYSANKTVSVTTGSGANLSEAEIVINIDEASLVKGDNVVTVKLPSGVEFADDDLSKCASVSAAVYTGTEPTWDLDRINSSSFDMTLNTAGASDEAKLILTLWNLKYKSGSGDIVVDFSAPSGSAFPNGTVTIGKIVGGGQTNTSIAGVTNIGDGTNEIDDITIEELVSNTIKPGDEIKLSLSKGLKWVTSYTDEDGVTQNTSITKGWAFKTLGNVFSIPVLDDEDELIIKVAEDINGDDTDDTKLGCTTPGKLTLQHVAIAPTDSADFGDVEIDVDSDNSDITEQTITVAKYADYGVTVEEGTKETVTSGRTEQEIGDFLIKEGVKGSLLAGRTLKLELPDGVEWMEDGNKNVTTNGPEIEVTDGAMDDIESVGNWSLENDNQTAKITIPKLSTDAATLKIKKAEVNIDADFEGPIEITVSGSAGAKGTVVVAEAVKPVKISAENVKDIIVGQANQKVADIILTEGDKDLILDKDDHKDIVIGLDEGYKFSAKPTVTVEEGNLEIDSTKLQDSDSQLKIVVKNGSSKASKIKISDVAITALRYVPVGSVKAELVAAEVDSDGKLMTNVGSTALVDWATDKSMGNVVIANCVTPAEGVSSQFKIGSNVYTVNGIAKIMDVAPYIKDSRTYVPVRYLAYALGVSESDVVWDAATSKVTITKGDKVVELTIGSTTITVNGEAQTMDVAPEIVNSRTMLPARFVAEGLGATVAWDAASSTVYVQQ